MNWNKFNKLQDEEQLEYLHNLSEKYEGDDYLLSFFIRWAYEIKLTDEEKDCDIFELAEIKKYNL